MTWRRPTLPRLGTQYHGRWGISRPSSGWDRVRRPRQSHQVVQPRGRCDRDDAIGTMRSDRYGRSASIGAAMQVLARGARGVPEVWPVWPVARRVMWMTAAHDGCYRACRAIRTGQLRALPRFHIRPIDVMVYHGPPGVAPGRPGFEVGFPLRCFQRLSRPHLATRPCRWRDNRCTRGASIPVLSYWGQLLSSLLHPRQIGTELSHDVLNPAHVPL